MKIKPIFIEVTNFLSYHYQRFDFKNGLFFISGANGAGKTSFFIESCSYCLYNKSMSGKKLSELINKDATKNMVVSVLLNINNQFVLVERGESPKKFSVFVETKENISFVNKKTRLKINDDEFIKVNDIILKKSNQLAENFDMQEWLEESILKMNHKDFITYVLKSKAKDLSYLEMNKDERDKYLENLFNLGTFRVMNESLKLKMKDQEIIVEKQKKELDKFKIELEFEEKKNLELKELFDRNNEDKINIQKKAIEKLDNEDATTKIIQENLLSTNKEINQLKLVNPVEKIDNHIEQNNQEIIILEKKNDALENSYTKDDKISEIKKKEIEANLSNLDKTIEDDKKEIKTTGEKLKIEIADIEKEIKNQTELLTEHSKSYDNLSDLENKELEILTKQNEATKQNIQENNLIIESNKKKLYDLKTKYEYESGLYETNKKDLNEKKFKLLGKVEASKDLLKNFNIEDKDLLKKEIESQLPLLEKKYPNLYSFLINFSKSLNETIDNISLLENKISKIKEKLDALENNKITVDGLSLDIRHTEVKIFEITEQNDGLKENLDTNKKLIETLNSEISGKLSVFTAKKYNLELKLNNLNNSLNKKQNDLVELRNNYKKMDIEKTKQLELLNKQLQDNLSDAVLLEKKLKENILENNQKINNIEKISKDLDEQKKVEKENHENKITVLMAKFNDLITQSNNREEELRKEKESILKKIEEIENSEVEINNDNLERISKNISFYTVNYTDEYNKFIRLDTIKKILTNKFNIKIYIMEKFRLFLNRKISQYSTEFKIPCLPLFDTNFDIRLNGFGYNELSIKSLSAGEVAKTSLAILFASNDVKKNLYNHHDFEMMLFDEVLSNIDIYSIFDILKVLKAYSEKYFIGVIAHGFGEFINEGNSIEIVKTEKTGSQLIIN